MTASVTFVIVNWNAGAQLGACVESISKFGESIRSRIVVVDNGSTDGSETSVEGLPDVSLIRAGENLGFGKACNLGARDAKSEFLLFLNPDAMLYENTLSAAVQYMTELKHRHVGICGVQLVDEHGHIARSCARFPSARGFFVHALGLDRVFPRVGYAMSEWDHEQTRFVDHVIGAFFLVRREVFESLSGFDERFFVYLEDLDFSYRAHQAGWGSVYLADVQAFHEGGGTSKQVKAKRLFYSLRSRLVYASKHYSRAGAALVVIATLFLEPLSRIVNAALHFSWPTIKETLSAYRMLWKWIPEWKGVLK